MPNYQVGDIVEMKYGLPNQRIVAVYPMRHIPSPDRVDVVTADDPNDAHAVGIPIAWIAHHKSVSTKGRY